MFLFSSISYPPWFFLRHLCCLLLKSNSRSGFAGLAALTILVSLLTVGCASTEVVSHEQLVSGPLPKPHHIWVYDFAATPGEVPRGSGFSDPRYAPAQPESSEQVAAGRQAGALVASMLVAQIREMGLPAEGASSNARPQIDDMVLRGYFISIDKGSATKRFVIGFGSGASELTTAVEGYQVTYKGLRKLGSDTVHSGGNKMPGEALGVVGLIATSNPAGLLVGSGVKAVGEASGTAKIEGRAKATAREIAFQLRTRFQEMAWIN